ncbi:NAD(P)H-quinone oxidoreductase subunit L, chloroplastic [Eucalyptus grandis]|uniref:NAD(P)H-quinone oxidoreductase subunit L, chloroplastic n=1 Tax=Eucalyptus grandis TaxID=71139 RepID=UPI00192E875B|nr:NAD(P)H-quinone oxidoreductase subunit L, chloroplastic [Eucalyptus grandis]
MSFVLSSRVLHVHARSLPSLSPSRPRKTPSIACLLHKPSLSKNAASNQTLARIVRDCSDKIGLQIPALAIQVGAFLATTIEQPAMAVTGVNDEEDFTWILIQLGIVAFWYFLIMPPIIMNWLRIRWYRRNLLEMYFQFMFVFLFFPGVLLWAPFLNFRKFPRDPSLKYPWSTPEDPSLVKNSYLKYPFAQPEDYE